MEKTRVVITGLGVLSPFGNLKNTVKQIKNEYRCYKNIYTNIKINTGIVQNYPTGLIFNYKIDDNKFNKLANKADKFAYIATKEALNNYIPDSNLTGVAINSLLPSLINITTIQDYYKYNPQNISTGDFFKIFKNSTSFNIAQAFKLYGECFASSATCATSLQNIILGYRAILAGDVNMMICGGTEEYHEYLTYMFYRLGIASKTECKPLADDRDGTIISEGAGIIILEELEHALQRNATIYGEIVGISTNCSDNILSATKESIKNCMWWCNAKYLAKHNKDVIINAHATGTILGDNNELEVIKELFPNSEIRTYKQYLGHTMAANGAIELAIDLYNQDFKYILKNSFGLGGTNCSILIKKYEE